MSLNGNLAVMPLTDLLQWLAGTRATGTLRIDRGKVCKRIRFQDGRVTGCSSDDPPALLGQFLLARGHIEREHLRQALSTQQESGKPIGEVLLEMGVLDRRVLDQALAAKAEDTIFGMFDWEDATFSFDEEGEPDPYSIRVDMQVDDIVLRGIERQDEMRRFRAVFPNDTVILDRTEVPPPAEVLQNRTARRVYEAVNGERPLAEITLHAHASEFLVIKLLYLLQQRGMIAVHTAPTPTGEPAHASGQPLADKPPVYEIDMEASHHAESAVVEETPDVAPSTADEGLAAEIAVAMRFLERDEYQAALEILNASFRRYPQEVSLRQLIAKAERGLEQSHLNEFALDRIPRLIQPGQSVSSLGLSPEASFLPTLLDGNTDIRSILWLAPMRSVDVLLALKQLRDKGLIEVLEPAPVPEPSSRS